MDDKLNLLLNKLESYESAVVAFSGGVDSTFLLTCSVEALGPENVMAVTAVSPMMPRSEADEAAAFCERNGLEHVPLTFDMLGSDEFVSNPADRCYHCKRVLFWSIKRIADRLGFSCVIEGSNKDDEGDYRPGLRALDELGIKSPLRELGFTKSEIRQLSAKMGLWTSDKPSMACLATRIPYGERITQQKLSMIERAEALLFEAGFSQARVRIHGEKDYIARIEVPGAELNQLLISPTKEAIASGLKDIGFAYVSADLEGYRTGSMNEVL